LSWAFFTEGRELLMAGQRKGAKKPTKDEPRSDVLQELETLKRLLMLGLVASGVKPIDIAVTLGVAKSVISRVIPVRKLSFGKKGKEGGK
jgi:hypothetical protein